MANCLPLESTDFNPFLMETHTATDATIKPQRMGGMVYGLALGRNDFISSVYVLFKSYNHTLVLLLNWGISFPFLFLSDIVSFFQTAVLKVLSLSKNLTKPEHML